MTNPFPGAEIKAFLSDSTEHERVVFALASAQRAVTVAEDAVEELNSSDRELLLESLDTGWNARTYDSALASRLMDQLVDEDDDDYTFYNSAVNDALTATIYAVQAGSDDADSMNAFYAAQTFFNIADLIAQRGAAAYPTDLSSQPVMAYAADCLKEDLTRVQGIAADGDLQRFREICISEAQHLTQLLRDRTDEH